MNEYFSNKALIYGRLSNDFVYSSACVRDIYVLMESFDYDRHFDNQRHMVDFAGPFLAQLMASLPTGYQIAIAKVHHSLEFLMHFNDSKDAIHLSYKINHLDLSNSFGAREGFAPVDFVSAVEDLINEFQQQHNGARAGIPKSVLILTNTRTDKYIYNTYKTEGFVIATLKRLVQSITVVDVGGNDNIHLAARYATDASHELSVPTNDDLIAVVPQLVSLLCA